MFSRLKLRIVLDVVTRDKYLTVLCSPGFYFVLIITHGLTCFKNTYLGTRQQCSAGSVGFYPAKKASFLSYVAHVCFVSR